MAAPRFGVECVRSIVAGEVRAMQRTTRPRQRPCAGFSVLLSVVCAAAMAGEPRDPMPTTPTLFYACMSSGRNPSGSFEYDSAAFERENPGSDYKDHYDLNIKMTAAFDEYLTQKYGFHGLVQCGHYTTLAEAKQWLQGRESRSRSPGMSYKYFATDWTYDAAPTGSAPSATTTTHDATAQAAPAAASAASVPTAFYYCVGVLPGVAYESAVFEAGNDAFTARRMYFEFKVYLNEKHRVNATARCTPRPTRAEAEKHLQEFPGGASGDRRVATGWVYNPTPN